MEKITILPVVFLLFTGTLLGQPTEKLVLEKIYEPNEKAFTILKPQGWQVEGGVTLWDPIASGGAANAIESKIDFVLKSDLGGTIQIHWLPDIYFVDMAGSMVAGMFPEGSFYNGMPVLHKMNATTFLQNHLAPYLHPDKQVSVTDTRVLPKIEKFCYDNDIVKEMQSKYSSAVVDFSYTKNGIRYHERAFCIIHDMGPYTTGMWKNRSTVVIRAPEKSFSAWEPLFHEIGQSVVLNPTWVSAELKGQMQRGSTMIKTMNDIARIGEEIQKGHTETNAKINHQAYLNLTSQEDYINPHTNKVETGSNQWDHRWVDDLGNVIYTNNQEYNPNFDLDLQMEGFRKSKAKQ